MGDTRSTVAISDTSAKAYEFYVQRLKEMTPTERVDLGSALWDMGDSIQRAAAKLKNPHANEAEITFRVAIARFGLELARKAYRRP